MSMWKLDGRILDGAVHPLDLTIGPRVPGLGQAMIDVVASVFATALSRVFDSAVPRSGTLAPSAAA
jgi:hypothetical protein